MVLTFQDDDSVQDRLSGGPDHGAAGGTQAGEGLPVPNPEHHGHHPGEITNDDDDLMTHSSHRSSPVWMSGVRAAASAATGAARAVTARPWARIIRVRRKA